MRSPFFCLFILCGLGCSDQRLDDPRIKVDGVYRSKTSEFDAKGNEIWQYLRFFDDGVVIHVSSFGKPSDLKKWFDKDRANTRRGIASCSNGKIKFSTKGIEGQVDFDGAICENRLNLVRSSKIRYFEGESKLSLVFVGWADDVALLADE